MEYKNIFSFDVNWSFKTAGMLLFLVVLPNLLGMINITAPYGFKVHFFQVSIFVAALIYGPFGGLLSGLFGSAYSAVITGNPYLAIGNAILGFAVGMFARYGFSAVLSVLFAFVVQLLWLVPTDLFLMDMPGMMLSLLIMALLASDIIWAIVAGRIATPIKRLLQ